MAIAVGWKWGWGGSETLTQSVSPGFNWCRFGVDEEDLGSTLRLVVHATLHCLRMAAKAKTGIIISSETLLHC